MLFRSGAGPQQHREVGLGVLAETDSCTGDMDLNHGDYPDFAAPPRDRKPLEPGKATIRWGLFAAHPNLFF